MHLLQIAARNKGADSLCFIQYNPPPLNRETACTREYICRLQGTKQNPKPTHRLDAFVTLYNACVAT